jgi:hypothetical protein
MKDRCNNPKNKGYHNYGGRGISVCERWWNFWNFVNDMGPKPSVLHTLERVNNEGHYEPFNVIWALPRTQQNNRRNNHQITWKGRTQNISGWAMELNIPYNVFWARLQTWSLDRLMVYDL